MKPALRWIPTEVWVDIFRYPWINRMQLGRIVDQIGNRKFAEFLHFYLHEWGKQTLKMVHLFKEEYRPRPQTPMPENIKFFEDNTICHFNASSLNFLRQVQTLFHGVNLQKYIFDKRSRTELAALHTALPHLVPLLRSIHSLSITIDRNAIPLVEQHFAQHLGQIKALFLGFDSEFRLSTATIQTAINFGKDWLQRGSIDEPKLLEVEDDGESDIFQQFCTAIKQQFLSAKTPRTFAVQFCLVDSWQRIPIPSFHLENAIGEQLRGEEVETYTFQINRHAANAGNGLEEWMEKTVEKTSKSCIDISRMTIGPIEAIAANENDGENEEDGPSASKKPKLAA